MEPLHDCGELLKSIDGWNFEYCPVCYEIIYTVNDFEMVPKELVNTYMHARGIRESTKQHMVFLARRAERFTSDDDRARAYGLLALSVIFYTSEYMRKFVNDGYIGLDVSAPKDVGQDDYTTETFIEIIEALHGCKGKKWKHQYTNILLRMCAHNGYYQLSTCIVLAMQQAIDVKSGG